MVITSLNSIGNDGSIVAFGKHTLIWCGLLEQLIETRVTFTAFPGAGPEPADVSLTWGLWSVVETLSTNRMAFLVQKQDLGRKS